ncbi:hypothetical protein Afe05nite_54190 [Paractinoplanes ferrugineus]|uniref:Uncharacterized protein n=1 Tax=Paractinoplanes ferrugineus TaxID=113564 RepID=A0A919MG82_9ACTN|nr:hypothetical protein Afe05nite_54190 [Actinoplanes ferrugineus]
MNRQGFTGPAEVDVYAEATLSYENRQRDPAYRAIRGPEQAMIDFGGCSAHGCAAYTAYQPVPPPEVVRIPRTPFRRREHQIVRPLAGDQTTHQLGHASWLMPVVR